MLLTGSELVRGDLRDENGPYLARSLLEVGIDPIEWRIVGDAEADLERALREGLRHDLLVVSGGLGPTHDDRTVELLARVTGRALRVDPDLKERIEAWSRETAERLRRPYADFEEGVRKQASLPEGALVVGLAGTAPSLVLEAEGCVAVTLPGPPRELRALWPRALETPPLRRILAATRPPERRVLRFYGVPESSLAEALAAAGGEGDGMEATICARDFEVYVDLVADPAAAARADELEAALSAPPLDRFLVTRSDTPTEALVLEACRGRGLTLATAESCTGGLVAGRLTSVPGSSDVFLGGIVAYADAAKEELLGVPKALLVRHGAVSAEVAAAMAQGARERLGADVAVAVTGIAGPGGGSAEKPVGLVFLHATGPEEERPSELHIPGDRATVRARATVAALQLVRELVVAP